jgi:hypothetical protein
MPKHLTFSAFLCMYNSSRQERTGRDSMSIRLRILKLDIWGTNRLALSACSIHFRVLICVSSIIYVSSPSVCDYRVVILIVHGICTIKIMARMERAIHCVLACLNADRLRFYMDIQFSLSAGASPLQPKSLWRPAGQG